MDTRALGIMYLSDLNLPQLTFVIGMGTPARCKDAQACRTGGTSVKTKHHHVETKPKQYLFHYIQVIPIRIPEVTV